MMALQLSLLGAPSVLRDGTPVALTARKVVALLAYLAVTNKQHTRDALATLFWPEADSEHARGALRYTLAQLRAELGDAWLATSRERIGLAARDDLHVDVGAVEALYAQVRAHGHPIKQPCAACAPLLREAVALQRGPLLAGFSLRDSPVFDDWLLFESERFQRTQGDAFAALIDGYRAAAPAEAIPYAQRWLALDTLNDDANRVLLELLIASGERGAAQRHYLAYAKLLHDELGVEPDAAATTLIERMQAAAPTPDGAAQPATARVATPAAAEPHIAANLPYASSPLVGRAHEVAALGRLLDDPSCRVLTLLGPGGSGKTRLALALGDARRGPDSSGVRWVALTGIAAAGALAATIAAAAGCPLAPGDDPERRLLDFLRERRLLLVLDNFEQLIQPDGPAEAVGLLERMLATAPALRLLITSRVRLQLYEEQLYPVHGLDFPELDTAPDAQKSTAVQLFVARARHVKPHFALSDATTPHVARIVRLLAGQPLAIELAAGWIGVLQPDEIARELGRGIDLLATDERNVPERHRSMRSSYALSWRLLRPDVRAVQRALSVFQGGFTREAAERVAGATPRTLRTLLDHSLLANSGRTTGTRYELHELLRQFAAEQLAQVPELESSVLARHAGYYLDWLVEQMAHAPSPSRSERLAVELENVRAAWLRAAQQQDFTLLENAIDQVCGLFQQQGRTDEGMALCEPLIARLDAHESDDTTAGLLFRALTWQAVFSIDGGRMALAHQLLERGLALPANGNQLALAFNQRTRGYLELLSGDLENASSWLQRGLDGYRRSDDRRGMASSLSALGRAAWLAGDYALARQHYSECITMYRALEDRFAIAHALAELALPTVFGGNTAAGLALLDQSRRLSDELDDPAESHRLKRHLGATLYNLGRYGEARTLLELCIAHDEQIGNRLYSIEDQLYLAMIQLIERQFDPAIRTSESMLASSRALGSHRNTGFALALLGQAELGRGAYLAARERLNESLIASQASHLADDPIMIHWGLSQVERALGDVASARRHALAALELAANGRGDRAAILALSALIGVLAEEGQLEPAYELEALVLHQPFISRSGFYFDLTVEPLARREGRLAQELVLAAQARGRARNLGATVAALWAAQRAA